jgi:hypothetical protein
MNNEANKNPQPKVAQTGPYSPGACNIGTAEIRARWLTGWSSAAVTSIVWIGLAAFDVAALWYCFLALPAMGAGAGFAQAQAKFCFNFGLRRVFNFGKFGTTTRINDPRAIQADRRRSFQIVGIAVVLGIAVTGIAVATA